MAILEIVKYPDPILKKVAESVGNVTGDIKKLVDDMFDTMYASDGVGLAAPQVGVGLRVIVVDVGTRGIDNPHITSEGPIGRRETTEQKYEMINPKITSREGQIEWEEGCLSIPDFRFTMKRSAKISVEYLDRNGLAQKLSAQGIISVAIQHEIDHLDGKLLIDNVSCLKRDLYLEKASKK